MDELHTALQLTLEQQFAQMSYNRSIEDLSREQAQELLRSVIAQLAIKDNIIKHLMHKAL